MHKSINSEKYKIKVQGAREKCELKIDKRRKVYQSNENFIFAEIFYIYLFIPFLRFDFPKYQWKVGAFSHMYI